MQKQHDQATVVAIGTDGLNEATVPNPVIHEQVIKQQKQQAPEESSLTDSNDSLLDDLSIGRLEFIASACAVKKSKKKRYTCSE